MTGQTHGTAYLAYLAEVREFNEPGGMQDHVASSLGGINYIDFENLENPAIETILIDNFPHVMLGDSQTPKDTLCILNKIKQVASDIDRERAVKLGENIASMAKELFGGKE